MKYAGSCHCGDVAFEVEGELAQALSCNCSICRRKAALMWFVPQTAFRLLTRPEAMSTYTFNQHVIQHRFCKRCGIHAFGEASDPRGNPVVAVNVRCLDDVDLDAVPLHHYDGRAR